MTGESGGFLQNSFFLKMFIHRLQPWDSNNAVVGYWFKPPLIQIKHSICAFYFKHMCTCLLSSDILYFINTRDPYFFYYNVQWLPRDISVVRKLPNIKFRQEVRVYHSEYVFKVFHTARKRLCYSLEKKCAYCLDCCLIEIDDSFILILFLICLIRFLISLVTYSSKLNNFIPCGNHSVPITILFSIFECSVLICINLQVFFFP